MPPTWSWEVALLLTAISAVGGSLGYAARTLDAGRAFKIGMFVLEGIFSAFFGFLIGVINIESGVPVGISSVFVGVLSWGGYRVMMKFLKTKAQVETDNSGG